MSFDLINNVYDFENSEQGMNFLNKSLGELFPEFKLVKSFHNDNYHGYGVEYEFNSIKIKIGCERSALTHLISISSDQLTLYKFDKNMKKVLAFSRKNILYTLTLLRKVLKEKSQL